MKITQHNREHLYRRFATFACFLLTLSGHLTIQSIIPRFCWRWTTMAVREAMRDANIFLEELSSFDMNVRNGGAGLV
jgi:hypothetical protein